MFSTINKLIWVVAFVPFIQAQQTEFSFTRGKSSYNVSEHSKITLVCSPPSTRDTITIVEYKDNPNLVTGIVTDSVLEDNVSDRFEYSITPMHNMPTRHELVILDIDRDQNGHTYQCISTISEQLTLNVYYLPSSISCRTALVNESKLIQCTIPADDQHVDISISSPNMTYNSTASRNGTYLMRSTTIDDSIDASKVKCNINQYYIQDETRYNIDGYSCPFSNLGRTRPTASTMVTGGSEPVTISIAIVLLAIITQLIN